MNTCESAIEIHDLSFSYQKKLILDNIRLDIPKAKISLLMGASGCGKSTLAYIVSGLFSEEEDATYSGEIKVFNHDIKSMSNSVRARYISMMFQNPELQFCMDTLRKEMRFCLENIGVDRDLMDEKIDFAVNTLSLNYLLDRSLFSLSGGEKQKVALCCLFVLKSKCIILDEPFANLDSQASSSLINLLVKLRDQHGISILAIDHQIDNWMGSFDNLILLGQNAKVIASNVDEKSLPKYESIFHKEGVFFPTNAPSNESGKNYSKSNIQNTNSAIELSNLIIRCDEGKSGKSKIHKYKKSVGSSLLSFPFFKKIEHNSDIDFLQDNSVLIHQSSKIIIKENSMTALLGKSGCGKTTLFLSLLKQHKYSGNLLFDKRNVNDLKLKYLCQNIGIVFQNPINQFVTQNVYDEVYFSLKLWNKGLGEKELKSKSLQLLDDYGLGEYKNYSPYMLSQGQMRRLAVLSVLSGNQSILLLDEPTYGQDSKSTQTIMTNLKSKIDNDGLTVLFSTHDRRLSYNWADQIYEIKDKSFVNIQTNNDEDVSYEKY